MSTADRSLVLRSPLKVSALLGFFPLPTGFLCSPDGSHMDGFAVAWAKQRQKKGHRRESGVAKYFTTVLRLWKLSEAGHQVCSIFPG